MSKERKAKAAISRPIENGSTTARSYHNYDTDIAVAAWRYRRQGGAGGSGAVRLGVRARAERPTPLIAQSGAAESNARAQGSQRASAAPGRRAPTVDCAAAARL